MAGAVGAGIGAGLSTIKNAGRAVKAAAQSEAGQAAIRNAAQSAVVGGAIGGGASIATGGDAWEGAKRGAMIGGIGSLGKSAYSEAQAGTFDGLRNKLTGSKQAARAAGPTNPGALASRPAGPARPGAMGAQQGPVNSMAGGVRAHRSRKGALQGPVNSMSGGVTSMKGPTYSRPAGPARPGVLGAAQGAATSAPLSKDVRTLTRAGQSFDQSSKVASRR